MKQTKFRPHWLLDTGDKIYADEVYCPININVPVDKYWLIYYFWKNHNKYPKIKSCEPDQYTTKECDFNILFHNGTVIHAKWIARGKK